MVNTKNMNRRNNWEQLLGYANEDLAQYGWKVRIWDYDGEGYYICTINKDDGYEEVYAENFYEDELADLVNEVWHYVKSEKC